VSGAAVGAAGRAAAGAAARDPCGDFTVGLLNTTIRTLKRNASREKPVEDLKTFIFVWVFSF